MKLNFTAAGNKPAMNGPKIFSPIYFTIVLLLCAFAFAEAQPNMNTTLATNTTTANLLNTNSRKSQQLYYPTDLAGLQNGQITQVWVRWGANPTGNYTNFTIKLGQTTNTTFTGTGNLSFYTGLTTVFSASNHTITAGTTVVDTWISIPITVPFYYENNKTLIVEIAYETVTSSSINVRGTTAQPAAPNHKAMLNSSNFQAITGTAQTIWPAMGFTVLPYSANDAGVVAINAPSSPSSTGNQNVQGSIRNFGTSTLTSANINWHVNGVPQVPFAWSGSLAPGQISAPVMIGSFNFSSLGYYNITAFTSFPNGVADGLTGNDGFSKTVKVCDALSGNYTINGALSTTGTNFTSVEDAVEFLKDCGINGPVTFNVSNGPYSGHIAIPPITGASNINTITFNGNGSTITHDGTTTTGNSKRATILLDGAHHVTFNNFNINATGTLAYGVHLINGASNNTIFNCTVTTSTTSTTSNNTAGIAASGDLTSVTVAGNGINNNIINNNTIIGGYQGVVFTGPTQAGNIISNNIITDSYLNGIQITGNEMAQVSGNTISRPTRTNANALSAGTSGILLSTGTVKTNVFNNRIHGLYDGMQAATTTAINGISILTGTTATTTDENKIYNNLIYNMRSNSIVNGINQTASPYQKIYHNTIVLDHAGSTATGVTRGYVQTTNADGIEFKNNIIYITRGGTGVRTAIALVTTNSPVVSNNNVLFVSNAANFHIGLLGAVNKTTLQSWVTDSQQDANSTDANPDFTDAANLNFIPTSAAVNNIGTNVGITADINGDPRNPSTPDPGVYEWTAPGLDAGVSWASPSLPTTAGVHPIVVNIANTKTITINSVELEYTDGNITVTETFTGLNLLGGANANLTFATPYNLTHPLDFTVSILSVNGIADDEAFNNSITLYLCIPLSGVYTINKAIVATDLSPNVKTFKSFNDLSAILSNCGVDDHVIVNVEPGSGPYNEQVVFQNISGLSALSTLTINGNQNIITTNAPIVSNLPVNPNPDRHIIRLVNLQYVTITNFKIERNIPSTSTFATFLGIHLLNSGNNIIISNNEFNMGTMFSATAVAGIVANSTATGVGEPGGVFDAITITGNTFNGGGNGISFNGVNSPGILIEDNNLTNCENSISIRGTNGAVIRGNNVFKDIPTGGSLANAGIQIQQTGNFNTIVNNNTIINEAAAVGTFRAIYVFGGTGHKVFNNVIKGKPETGANFMAIPLRVAADIYFNTIILDHTVNASINLYGIEEELSFNSFYSSKNNIIFITQTSSGIVAAHKLATNTTITSSNLDFNNNVYWVPNGNVFYRSSATPLVFPTLASWQLASGKDAASFETNPFFQSGTAIPTSGIINDGGVNIAGITTDITGGPRPNPPALLPDPGAYEFFPRDYDAAITNFIAPPAPHCATSLDVTFRLTNSGSVTLNSAIINWTVNGIAQPTFNWNGPSLLSGQSVNVVIGNVPVAGTNSYSFSATVSDPNGQIDENPLNNTFTFNGFRRGMDGTFTINAGNPVSSTNYQTFQTISNDLSLYGVCGPVLINVINGTSTEQVVFRNIPGASAVNTVTINGNGNNLTFNGTSSASKHVLQFNNAHHIIVDDLVINGLNNSFGIGIQIINGSTDIAIRNSTINVSTTGTTSDVLGISTAATSGYLTSTLPPSNNIEISGNTISGGYVGVNIVGSLTPGIRLTNASVINNNVLDAYAFGIQVSGADNSIIKSNNIHRPTRTNTIGTFYGIYYWNATENYSIEKNRIHSVANANLTTFSATGIRVAGNSTFSSSGIISNNLIYNFTNTNSQTGILDEASSNSPKNIFHNTIALDDVSSATTSETRAYYWNTTSTAIVNHTLRNNVFYISRGGTGLKRLIDVASATNGGMLNSDFNVLWFGTTNGTTQVGRIATNIYSAFIDWQGTGKDANSVNADPIFLNPASGNYQPTNSVTSGTLMGTSQVGGITDDINDVLRSLNPAPGAFEWSAFCEAPPTAGTATLETVPVCYNQSATITVTGTSTGIGLTTQWEYSTDNTFWNPVIGQAGLSLTTDPLTDTTYFRFAVTCDGETEYSNLVTIEISEIIPVIVSSDSLLCSGETALLSTQYSNDPGYSFVWNVNQGTDPTYETSSAGFGHTVVVTSPNGCVSDVSDPLFLSAIVYVMDESSLVIEPASCIDGYIEFALQGFIIPSNQPVTGSNYYYSIDSSAYQPAQPGNAPGTIQIPIAAGLYDHIYVLDATTGCVFIVVEGGYEHPSYDPLTLDLSVNQHVTCNGLANGSASVTANGGLGPYIVSWGTPVPKQGEQNDEIPAGIWTVTVTDANNCTATIEVTITQPEVLVASTASVMNVSCNGESNGSVIINASGGTAPYTGTGLKDQLAAGTYTFTVTDANNCTATIEVTITHPDVLLVTINSINSTYWSANNGTAEAVVAGGTIPYSYLWSNTTTAAGISGLAPGSYTVTVTDANGCVTSATVLITEPPFICSGTGTHVKYGAGGWGGGPSGTNPATYLYANFAAAFPNGVIIGHPSGMPGGCNRSMKWTTPQAVTAFLPSTGTPRRLDAGHPTNFTAAQYGNTFASQVVALTINVTFDAYDPNFSAGSTVPLGSMLVNINNSPYNNWTVSQLLTQANIMLACAGYSKNQYSAINDAIDKVNNDSKAIKCPTAPTAKLAEGGVINITNGLKLNAYPNPTPGKVTVEFETEVSSVFNLTVMDLSGRIMLYETITSNEGNNTQALDLTSVSKGIYIIKLGNEELNKSLRLVVQ